MFDQRWRCDALTQAEKALESNSEQPPEIPLAQDVLDSTSELPENTSEAADASASQPADAQASEPVENPPEDGDEEWVKGKRVKHLPSLPLSCLAVL